LGLDPKRLGLESVEYLLKFLFLGFPASSKYCIIKKAKSYALLLRGVGILFSLQGKKKKRIYQDCHQGVLNLNWIQIRVHFFLLNLAD